MAEPMGNERLARLARDNEPRGDHLSGLTADEVGELLDELERLRQERDELLAHPALVMPAETDISEEDRQRWAKTWADISSKVPDSTIIRLSRGVVFVPDDTPVSDDILRELNR